MLLERAPRFPMSKVFFANSGSEANDTAVKMIWYFNNATGRPEKKKIISRIKGYHGVTIGSASLTGLPYNHKLFDLPIAGIHHTSNPHFYHEGRPGETEEDFATRLAAELEELILREGPDTVAAFFAEPVMGAGGVILPPATYFEKIQAVLRRHDVLLVADEVIAGFGRTGNYWGSQTFGMQPDILTCAKALSSSFLPISAVMVNERVFEGLADGSSSLGTFGHGFTYSGHPVPAAVAVETLKIYDEMDIWWATSGAWRPPAGRLRERFADHPLVGEVRGIGLIGAVEFVEDKPARRNFDPAEEGRHPLHQGGGEARADHARPPRRRHRLLAAAHHHRGGDRGDAGALRPPRWTSSRSPCAARASRPPEAVLTHPPARGCVSLTR
jgi:4-aminobutyrate--pyruvate transaminase